MEDEFLGCTFCTNCAESADFDAEKGQTFMLFAFVTLFAEGDEKAQPGLGGNPLIMFALMGMAFVFLVLLPMRRQKSQQREMMSNIKRNDKVVTSGGIIGIVVDVREKKDDDIKEDELIIRVDENSNTRIRILKSAVAQIIPVGSPATEGIADKKA